MDEVESAGCRAAERRGAAGVGLLGVRGLSRFMGVWQLADRGGRRRGRRRGRQDRGRSWGQAAQPVGHRVRVQLNLRVVEVLLTVAEV